jgi:hypothetical protein
MTEMEKLFRGIVGIIAETDSQNNDKAIRIFFEFHSYLLDNSSVYLEDDYGVDFNDIINILETLDKPETGTL